MFGTDGIRGIVGEKITPLLCYGLGLAISEVFCGTAVVARDTRISGEELKTAISDGLTTAGINVIDVGIAPSPALAMSVKLLGADLGIMITASHNPPEYNGVKLFDRYGCKITREKERLIEFYFEHPTKKRSLGGKRRYENILPDYAQALGTKFDKNVDLDFGFGAGCVMKEFLDARTFNDIPRGDKINSGCGALHPEFVLGKKGLGWGFALDGDGDRLAVVHNGKILDGDSVLYNLARACKCDTVVTTVLSNSALIDALEKEGIRVERTPVGDKFVGERMRQLGCELGGEQSGHFILSDANCTGDALGAAAFLFRSYGEEEPVRLELYPQTAFDYPKSLAALPAFDKGIAQLRAEFDGRLVVRLSGTEPKVRFMAEHRDGEKLKNFVGKLKAFLDNLA